MNLLLLNVVKESVCCKKGNCSLKKKTNERQKKSSLKILRARIYLERTFRKKNYSKLISISACLKKTNFRASKAILACFTGANLEGADFTGAKLDKANFSGANLTNAVFKSAKLAGANFDDAILDGAVFDGSNYKQARGIKF
ncbi:pentapeptide repeat-containing protein [Vibrio parahaemolyticus]|nr:pentapeptide repeat-containing protein [Vibrio parahaemolyticus]MBE4286786.1 pentapeptide repeat-containing protein [Vibrio parahaemolyticus]MBE4336691.1 pentapeptide repeat-containing protein [Vibrio parahaemolyticus]MBE5141536.1 pentapeptide repeat-containing protein [Vibrio parahaemolyticus]TNY77104.1 hypothetical protein CGK63_05185 [Vibrio parahaemolyticus]